MLNGVLELSPIKDFLCQRRLISNEKISRDELLVLSDLLEKHANIAIGDNVYPLSVMEALALATALIARGYRDRADILGISEHTVRDYERRAKTKLDVPSKMLAVCKAIQMNIIEIL